MRLIGTITLIAAIASSAWCQTVTRVDLARDNGSGKPGQVVRSFSTGDNPLHCVVALKPLPGPTVFNGTLIAVNAGGVQNYRVASTDLSAATGMGQVDFKFSLPRPWPAGAYRIELKANGKPIRTVNFEIR